MDFKKIVLALSVGFGLSAQSATIVYDMNGSGGWNDTTRWVGGVVPSAGDTVEIPSGTAYATEADKAKMNSVIVNLVNADSVLSLTKSSVWNPMFKASYLKGCGRLEINSTTQKEALFDYNLSTFTGDIVLNSGKIIAVYEMHALGRATALSGTTSLKNLPPGKVYIRAGAELDVSGYGNPTGNTLGFKEIHIAGKYTGAQSAVYYPAGALGLENWEGGTRPQAYRNVILDEDAWVTGHQGANFGIAGESEKNPGLLDLCGHDLYLDGNSGRSWKLMLKNLIVTNSAPASGGHIYVKSPSSMHTLEIGTGVVFDRNVQIVEGSAGAVTLQNAGKPVCIDAELVIDKTGGAVTSLSAVTSGVNEVTLAGKVTVNEGKSLYLTDSNPGTHLTVSGGLAGKGTVTVKGQTMYDLTGDSSAFAGSLVLDDFYNWTGLRFGDPSSAPAASTITLNGSTIVVPFPAWSFSQYLALANGVTYDDAGGAYLPSVTIDPSECADSAYTLKLADGDLTNAKAALGIGGSGTVNVASLPATERRSFAAWAGTLKFSGNTPIKLGKMLATSFRDADQPGTILFDTAKDVDISSNCFWIGTPYQISANAKGVVKVVDSLLHNYPTSTIKDQEGFYVGNAGYGRLVFEDSVVTSRVHIGREANGVGEFIVKGGRFCHWGGGNSSDLKSMMTAGNRGHGYVEFDQVKVDCLGYTCVGYTGSGSGVLVQKGGSFDMFVGNSSTPTQLRVGLHVNAAEGRTVGQFRLTGGGKASVTHNTYVAAYGYDGTYDRRTYGTFTVDGEGSRYSSGPFVLGSGISATGIVNLNDGGTLYAKNFSGSSAGRGGKSYVNFNGGIYDHRGWGETYLFGLSPDAAEASRSVTKVTVYGKGATIISSSSHAGRRFGQPIHNATGKGVGSIPWTDKTRVFQGAPAVIIEGDGVGASAMADYDSATGTVTNFIVTSAGTDYTSATAYVVQAATTNAVIDLTDSLVDNDPNGSVEFRHTNNGSFIFDVANDYIGETTLSAAFADGAFNITNKDAFAESKAIKLKSGKLYLGSYTLADLTAPFKFMGGTVAGEEGSYVIPEGKMVIDLNDILAGEQYTVANNTNLTLPSSIAIWNGDTAQLDKTVKYTLLTLPKNYEGVIPTFTGVPKGWHVSRTATGFRLSYTRGLLITVR